MTATPHDRLSNPAAVSSDGILRRVSPRAMILAMPAAAELETKSFSIPSLLETIRKGRIRIPRFQRGFLWNDEDRRLLFDSIQHGYPIGTLLLACGPAVADSVNLGGFSANVEETSAALWVVDGQQRLSTLAMALLGDHSGAYRPIFFDLDSERFVLGSRRGARSPLWLPTHVLANSATLNKWLRDTAVSDAHSLAADRIAGAIRDYSLPAYLVPYDGRDHSALTEIFARTNLRGRALSSLEVFEALHASVHEGRGPIDRVSADLAQLGFGAIEGQYIERAAIAVLGGDPGRPLVDQMKGDPHPLFQRVAASLSATIGFLAEDADIPHVALLPYTGSLSTLARFFAMHERPSPRNRELLARWFWRGTLNEDHKTEYARDRKKWKAIEPGEDESIQRLLRLLPPLESTDMPSDLAPYRASNARTKIELVALAALQPRQLIGEEAGELVPIVNYLSNPGPADFPWVAMPPRDGNQKTIASVLLHPRMSGDEIKDTQPPPEMLASHGMDALSWRALVEADPSFLSIRTAVLVTWLKQFLSRHVALGHPDHDHAPLDSYFEDAGA